MTHNSLVAGSDMPKLTVSKVGGGEMQSGSAQGVNFMQEKHDPIRGTFA
jgi:putative aminopeptidase FrvX